MDYQMDSADKKIYEEFYNLIGAKIRFKCDGYIQEGIIKLIKPNAKRVTLNNVYFILPDKKIFSGTLKYRFDDLANYELIATAKELNPYPRFEYLENILRGNNSKKKYSLNDIFYDGYLSDSEEEEEDNKEAKEEEFNFETPSHLLKRVPQDFVTVDCFDLEWKQAIKHIGLQKTIGVSFHGYTVSRLGHLSWMCISTVWCVFLFDIEKLGIDAFNNGLKSILENQLIKKVIHDCRFSSDCLFHKFDTQLTNVFDTLVADFVVSMQCYNDKHKYEYVQCLNSCLSIYLDVPPEFSYARDRFKENGPSDIYRKRPLNNALRYSLIKDTIYLLQLYEVLAEKLLGPLDRNVNRYLKVIAGASKQELDTLGDEISPPDCIPPSLLMHGIQTVTFSKLEEKKPVSLKCKFLDPTTRKVIDFKKQAINEEESSPSASPAEVTLTAQNYSKEKSSKIFKGRQCPDLKEKKSCTAESLCLHKKSVIVDKIIAPCSVRHMDEVYHKLANSNYFDSKNTESVINIKPFKSYESKFTMRIPLECSAFSNRDSSETESVEDIDFNKPSSSSSLMVSKSSDHFEDCSDTWAKLQEVSSDESNVLHNAKKTSNIKFVPAGMSALKGKKNYTTGSVQCNKKSHTMKKPLECDAFSSSDSCSTDSDSVGNPNPPAYSSPIVSNTSEYFQDSSVIWAKLRAAHSDDYNVSQYAKNSSKIKFLPAGMSC